MALEELQNLVGGARVYDLAQPYFVGMPHFPTHPPFLYSLSKKHGDFVLPGGVSSSAEAIALGAHVGTHIDALCHFSRDGMLYGGLDTGTGQSFAGGQALLAIDTVRPILRRGVLLDIAALASVDTLPEDFIITPQHLEDACDRQKVAVRNGDVVLLRTGWARFWEDPVRYIRELRGPGPQLEGADWLSWRNIFAAGSDTVAFEHLPSPRMEVHAHLLVEKGIHIIEALNLEEIARDRVSKFFFVGLPLKIRGGTASPIRPVALAL